jgi:hypothetical protein
MQVITGDLVSLTEDERKQHYLDVCASLKINPALRPLAYFMQVGPGGKQTLILYTLRGGAQQIADANGISTSVEQLEKEPEGMFAFKAKAFKGGRSVESMGAAMKDSAKDLAAAFLTAETKATRRAILNFTGSGLLDETEVIGMKGDMIECDPGVGNEAYVPPPPAPVPSEAPATEVLELKGEDAKVFVEAIQNPPNPVPALVAVVAAANVFGNKAEMDKITVRLNSFRRETLQLGGMRPSKGFGIAAKWAKFLAKHAPNKTIEEYQTLLTALDLCLQQLGPAGVVEKIEKDIL